MWDSNQNQSKDSGCVNWNCNKSVNGQRDVKINQYPSFTEKRQITLVHASDIEQVLQRQNPKRCWTQDWENASVHSSLQTKYEARQNRQREVISTDHHSSKWIKCLPPQESEFHLRSAGYFGRAWQLNVDRLVNTSVPCYFKCHDRNC